MTLAGAGGALSAVALEGPVTVERRLYLMGTEATVEVAAADRSVASAAAERAVRALESAEARLSTWRRDSELSRLSRAPVGASVRLSPTLGRELRAAWACAGETGGAFDPAIGGLVDVWDLRGRGRIPAADEIAAVLPAVAPAALELHGDVAVRQQRELRIEDGGWGKGAGLDAALAALAAPGVRDAWLDLGGQSATLRSSTWQPTVADPDRRERPVVALDLAGGSLSTSGNGERGLRVDGRRIGHLLDPRTGRPAIDFGSLTVWAASALRADCLSTGLFVLGPDRALTFAATHPDVHVLVLERTPRGLRARASAGLRGHLRALAADVEVTFAGDVVDAL